MRCEVQNSFFDQSRKRRFSAIQLPMLSLKEKEGLLEPEEFDNPKANSSNHTNEEKKPAEIIHVIHESDSFDTPPEKASLSDIHHDEKTLPCSDYDAVSNARYPLKLFYLSVFLLILYLFSFKREEMIETAESADVAALRERFMAAFPHLKNTTHSLFPLLNATIFHDLLASQEAQSTKQHIGTRMYNAGARVKHPVVMVPGFVTSGLEVWSAKDCMKRFFRQRVWTALTGATSFLGERDCWKEHMMLDPWTGNDPEGIRIRAAEGFVAADFFVMNYWVWGKLIENLAEVGYSPSNMVMQPYDWRLPFHLLEERDGFFTNLKAKIESLHKITGKKVVLSTHSMGALVLHHFFAWVTSPEGIGGGNGGDKWVNEHIEAYINIAGSHLGVPKAATALLSGEMSDTVFGGRMASLVEHVFGRRPRRDLWSSWGSLWAMLPKGSDSIWGPGADLCYARSSDDPFCPDTNDAVSPMVTVTTDVSTESYAIEEEFQEHETLLRSFIDKASHTTSEVNEFLQSYGGGLGPGTAGAKFHSQTDIGKDVTRRWYDPSRQPLPNAPDLKIFCLYGTGLPTERAYHYRRNWNEGHHEDVSFRNISDPPLIIDSGFESEQTNTSFGIRYSDGDGSVPLVSLGYICTDAWRRPETGLNPSKSTVYTREYKHKAEFQVGDPMRGGPTSCDHVDILGNTGMIEDFIRVATGFESTVVEEDCIVSKIREISEAINAHPSGGIRRKVQKLWPWQR